MSSKSHSSVTILVCGGDACKENSSKKLRKKLEELVEKKGLEKSVFVEKAGCLDDCKKGPVVQIVPGKEVVKGVKPKHAEEILEKALAQLD